MAANKIRVHTVAENLIILPGEVVPLLSKTSEAELKTLIYVSKHKIFSPNEAAAALKITELEFEAALTFWRNEGILDTQNEEPAKFSKTPLMQSYDSKTLSDALEFDKSFASVKDGVEKMTGKILNKNDINSLFYLHDYCGFTSEYICCVAAYCTSRGKPAMQYIMKTCLSLFDEGIDNYKDLMEHLREREKTEGAQQQFIRLCGFSGRTLSANEKKHLKTWFDEYKMSFELVSLAYEKTVDSIGKVNFSYMQKILEEWALKGCKTPQDVSSLAQKSKNKSYTNDKNQFDNQSFDIDEFLKAAVEKG
ncbi:DnaD domain protein [Eubacteriales bacterium OttesenSCG-928-G02]|nr:DnaD domain protein [Eubacteriales bacterium OttesenSCG-928-G02]